MMQEYFGKLRDNRQAWKVKHNLLEIIVMTICAVIAGCDVWEDIADYCRVKETWFKESLHMKLGEAELGKSAFFWHGLLKGRTTGAYHRRCALLYFIAC